MSISAAVIAKVAVPGHKLFVGPCWIVLAQVLIGEAGQIAA